MKKQSIRVCVSIGGGASMVHEFTNYIIYKLWCKSNANAKVIGVCMLL